MRPEYDFSKMAGGVRGKYAESFREGTNLAPLEPDVAAAFPTDEQVNAALRSYLTSPSGRSTPEGPPNQAD